LKMILSNKLVLREVPTEIRQLLMKQLEMPNPKWIENERMGRWNGNTPQSLNFYEHEPHGGLIIPRGYIRKLILSCRNRNINYELIDNRRELAPVDFDFHGNLRPYQLNAVKKLLSKDFGTLSFPTGSGKTIVALYMIAKRKQPSMIVVHTRDYKDLYGEIAGKGIDVQDATAALFG